MAAYLWIVQHLTFSILTLLHSLQRPSQHGEGVCRMKTQEEMGMEEQGSEMKGRKRVESRVWVPPEEVKHALGGWG